MLVTLEEFARHAERVASTPKIFCGNDVETTGLYVRAGAKAFILGYAFDDINACVLTDDSRFPEVLRRMLSNPSAKYGMSNAKFELGFYRHQFGCEVEGEIWDSEVMARLQYNNHRGYSLAARAKRMGLAKEDKLQDWLKANKKLHHEAPLELIIPYVERDAWLEIKMYEDQRKTFIDWQRNSPYPIADLVVLEMKTTKNLFEMEDAGLDFDEAYANEALDYEILRRKKAAEDFENLTGTPLVSSAKALRPIFDEEGLPYNTTELGNPSFDAKSLSRSSGHPISKSILAFREADKRAVTYWENLLKLSINGRIYPNFRQAGTAHGRFSAAEPNVQNWPDDFEDPSCQYPVRRAFLAPKGTHIVSLDWSQMELRRMADEAGEMGMIAAFKQGKDFHQEVADAAQVPRGLAKNGRFCRLYGGGVDRLAETLGCSVEIAGRLAKTLDKQVPRITAYSKELINYARHAGFGVNWMGRRYFFDRRFEWKYPNYKISGGCSDIMRIAIDDTQQLIRTEAKGGTKLLIVIHDELVLRVDHCDMHLVPKIKQIMIAANRDKKHLDMDVSITKGANFHDLEDF